MLRQYRSDQRIKIKKNIRQHIVHTLELKSIWIQNLSELFKYFGFLKMYIFSCLWQKFQVVFVGRHSKCFVDGRRAAIWSSLAALCVSSTKWCISCSHQKKLEKAWWPIFILLLWYLLCLTIQIKNIIYQIRITPTPTPTSSSPPRIISNTELW